MSALIGGAIALIRTGAEDAFVAWISTAPIAFGLALPTSFFVVPFVQTRIDRLFGSPENDGSSQAEADDTQGTR